MSTTLIIENKYGAVTITSVDDDLDIHGMIDDLIKPALLAAGYQPVNVSDAFNEEEDS